MYIHLHVVRMDLGEIPGIQELGCIRHRFSHQLVRHERSGGLSTLEIYDLSARAFSDKSKDPYILKLLQF